VVGVLVTPSPASATPAWTIAPAPTLPGPADGRLEGITCVDAVDCTAVGWYSTNGVEDEYSPFEPLVVQWNGTAWKHIAAPSPSGASRTYLFGVGCASTSLCFAVGATNANTNPAHDYPLLEQWNGTAWAVVAGVPSTTDAGGLSSVSCSSATHCVAVGETGTAGAGYQPLMYEWNGTSWSSAPPPFPAGASYGYVSSVSCSSSRCTAVGTYNRTGGYSGFIDQWDGTEWSLATLPDGVNDGYFSAVSCPADNACFVVSTYSPVIERWDGTAWSVDGQQHQYLTGIDCESPSNCVAVGQNGTAKGVSEIWNGSSWAIKKMNDTFVSGVACMSATDCTAVGYYPFKTIMQRWNGTVWDYAPLPTNSLRSELIGISCATATSCMAVGTYQTYASLLPLGLLVNGTSYTNKPGALPSGATSASFSGVSCTSTTNCVAVGSSIGSTSKTLAERWNGMTWTILSTPNPSSSSATYLNGVSCVSATDCTAVGYWDGPALNGTYRRALIEHFNGSAWSIAQGRSRPGVGESILTSVSCTAANACQATGRSSDGNSLAEHWNGTMWSIDSTPGGTNLAATLAGVSCKSATACVAVGSMRQCSQPICQAKPLAVKWSGSSWVQTANPQIPDGLTAGSLAGVSCVAANSCDAVGARSSGKLLIEHWNGAAWSIMASPTRFGSPSNFLGGVSCFDANHCDTAGYSVLRPFELTLVGRYG
jgi:hypothetical protein